MLHVRLIFINIMISKILCFYNCAERDRRPREHREGADPQIS